MIGCSNRIVLCTAFRVSFAVAFVLLRWFSLALCISYILHYVASSITLIVSSIFSYTLTISEIDPDQLPPLDENGVPKYKGRKRGRKAKVRKRKSNPNRRKRQHTAYTLFVKEIYPDVKIQHPDWPSKDVISIVAKQWATVPAAEKQKWKVRAQATHDSADEEEDDDDEADEDEDEADEDEDDDKVLPGAPVDLQAAVAAAAAAAVEAGFGPDDTFGVEDVDDQVQEEDEDEDAPAPPARRRGRPSKRK
jgi:hypothetical protein